MAWFGPKKQQRQRAVKRPLVRRAGPWQALINSGHLFWAAVVALAFLTFASLLVIQSRSMPAYRPGQIVDRPQLAEVEFETIDVAATNNKRIEVASQTPAVYSPNTVFFEETRKIFTALPVTVAGKTEVKQIAPELADPLGLTDAVLTELRLALARYQEDGKPTADWMVLVDDLMTELWQTVILTDKEFQVQSVNWELIKILGQNGPRLKDKWVSVENEDAVRQLATRLAKTMPPAVRPVVLHYFINAKKPTYQLDKAKTAEAREAAIRSVQDVKVVYGPGNNSRPPDSLVPVGKPLEAEGYRLLAEHISHLPAKRVWLTRAGLIGLVALIVCSLMGYIVAVKPRVATNPVRGLAMATLMLLSLGLSWALYVMGEDSSMAAVIAPAVLVAVTLAIAYDQRFSLGAVVLYCLLTAVAFNLPVSLLLVMIVTSMVAVAQLREVRHRSTLSRVGLVTGLVAAGGAWASGLVERLPVEGMMHVLLWESIFAFVGCLFMGILVLGFLPFVERAFRVTTSMTLLELGDMNRPLLKRLAQEAPGTFNHSLQVATLAEAASTAIGANGLLARVGAYYHDIGKMNKPQYFVENQLGSTNLHDKLSPAMSLLIIVGHVKDGMEMARQYGLPPVLHHFIESHHGTTLVEYFYHAAKRKADEDDVGPEEVEYRYPGPKPQTKEAAILMLCDAVESACRTMAEPTAVRIEQLVHKLATKRLMDGQFDRCDISLAELHDVEASITKSLCAIYHGRISYPSTQPAEEPKAAVAG